MTYRVQSFIQKIIHCEAHYQRGELYMGAVRLLRWAALYKECKSSGWISPPMTRIPRQASDATKLPDDHYKDVFESCSPDDWQPRRNIKKLFDDGTSKLDKEEAILLFSNKFIMKKELVKDHLLHLKVLCP